MHKLLTVDQLSEYLQVSKSTIYTWTHEERIPHYKLGIGVRFRDSEIEVWLKRRKKKERKINIEL